MTRPTHPAAPWDPGVQNERTSLAWSRTGLGIAACVLLLCRLAIVRQWPWAVAVALACLAGTTAALGWAVERYRRAASRLAGGQALDCAGGAATLSAAVALVGLLGIALIFIPH